MNREYGVGWGTLALINAGLAQTKHRSALTWFLISLFIGPIATFLIVVLDAEPVAPPSGGPPAGFTRDPLGRSV